jgi:exonuclease SbcC
VILTHLELQNFKNFKKKELEFSSGINVLQGPNGSGKTSILEAIEFALFGSVTRTAGLEPLVNVEESVASVSLTFDAQHNSGTESFTVFRQITKGQTGASTTTTRLTRGGLEISAKKLEVDAQILTLIGLPHGSYGNSCYIRQGEIRNLLEAGKDREREIDRMIGLGVFEDAWRDLRKEESDLEKQATSAKEKLIRAQAELENLLAVSDLLSERMQAKIRAENEIKGAEEPLGGLSGSQVAAGDTGDMVQLERGKAALAQKIQGLEEQAIQLEQKTEAANDRLLEMEAEVLRRERRIESLQDERNALLDRISRIEAEMKTAKGTLQELASEVLRHEADMEVQRSLINAISQMEVKGDLLCPLCRSELTPDHARETRRSLDRKISDLQESVERKRTDLRRFEQSAGAAESRTARLQAQLDEIAKEIAEADAQNKGMGVAKEEIEAELGSSSQMKRDVERALERERRSLQDLERTAAERPVKSVDEQLAESKGRYLANKQILQRLEEEIPELMERLAEQQMKKANLKAAEEAHSGLAARLQEVRDIRWAFNNIGPYARKKVLSSVAERTQKIFSKIYAGSFIKDVELTQDYDIRAETPSGVQLPSKLLSVGERVIAGLALRIGLAQARPADAGVGKGSEPGFLILDEPTEYLDDANVSSLARTLAGLKALGQIVIVTHDRELMEGVGTKAGINTIILAGRGRRSRKT